MKYRILLFIVLVVSAIVVAYIMTLEQQSIRNLPIIQPKDVKKEMVDPELLQIGMGHRIGDFSLLNQYGETVSLEQIKGKVFVAEYFFTTCGTTSEARATPSCSWATAPRIPSAGRFGKAMRPFAFSGTSSK